jgi:hypothetical protein
MKKFCDYIKNNKAQATIEYVLFLLIMFAASYGMIKLFIVAWKNKFNFISVIVGISDVFF